MADPMPCRWGAVNVLMRLKNKIREKFFWDRILADPNSSDSPTPSASADVGTHSNWTDYQHDDEASGSTHRGYFDAMDGSECAPAQALEDPSFPQFASCQTSPPDTGMLFSQQGENHYPKMLNPLAVHEQEAYLTIADFDLDIQQPWTAQMDQRNIPFLPPEPLYGNPDDYLDAPMEFQDDQTSSQSSYRELHLELPSTVFERREMVEMMDTGDSSSLNHALQPAQWQQIMLFRQFFEIDGVAQPGAGWRVVLGIVSACRKISELIRIRRLQRPMLAPITALTARRIGSGEGRRYKGIRQRNGKWVSEIRIGGTQEKVWLGSYNTEKEAALAFDAGNHHCCAKKSKSFNFHASPRLLGSPLNLSHLSSIERRNKIKQLAEDHARAYGSANIR